MARKHAPVHVVKNTRKYKGKTYTSYLLRRSIRVGSKVIKETVANISHLPVDLIDIIQRYLKGERFAGTDELFDIEQTLPHGHVAAVLGTLRGLWVDTMLGSKPSRRRTLTVAMIVARIIDPCSKLATARGLDTETQTSSVADVLGVESVDVDELYEAMDWLLKRQPRIESELARRHLSDGSLVLYDLTSVYFEGRTCPLAKLGHPRDGKKGKLQIAVGLLCNSEGCPVSVQVFEGNTGDPKTLLPQIQKLRGRFGLNRVILVGDRGMITEARLREDIRPDDGLDWITALRAPAMRHLVDSGSLQLSIFDEKDMAEITDPEYPGERLIVCRNPLLAEQRARKREDLLQATEKGLNEIVAAAMRRSRPLKGEASIALKVGKILNRFKVAKYFQTEITDTEFRYCRDKERIAQDAALDGFYVIRTSVSSDVLSAERAVMTYKGLSVVERAFRSLKSMDLKVRPIHHHLEDRVRAHVFICMLAYYVEWHMRKALAPLLFDDEQKVQAQGQRESVVAPARRSPHALSKVQHRRGEDGLPVTSFRSLLEHLATLAKNKVKLNVSCTTFDQFTEPTPLQQKAFDLLGISYRM
jgi:transposase